MSELIIELVISQNSEEEILFGTDNPSIYSMNNKLNNYQPNPKRLKSLASDVTYSKGNNLLHQFVLDNSDPNHPASESCTNAVLMTIAGTPMDVNALNNEGYSPLHLAALKNNASMVRKLLSCLANVDVNRKCSFDRDENTALHLAAELGNLSVIRELLQNCADVDKRNVNGFTALCFAAKLGNLDVMEILLKNDADVNATCACRVSRFHYSIEFHNSEALKSFIREGLCSDFIDDYKNETILKYSVKRDRAADILLSPFKKYIKIRSQKTCKGLAPLHFAVQYGNIETINFLLNNGADLNVTDYMNATLLHYAASCDNNVATAAFLVNKGVNINSKNNKGDTPLHYAAQNDNEKIIEFLIKNGADLNARTSYNENALHHAVYSRKIASVELLVNSGFDLEAKNKEGHTPLICAINVGSIFFNLNVVKFLVSKGADVNAKDRVGNSCLAYAIDCHHLEAIKVLVGNGADLCAVTRSKDTALVYAQRQSGIREIVSYLSKISGS